MANGKKMFTNRAALFVEGSTKDSAIVTTTRMVPTVDHVALERERVRNQSNSKANAAKQRMHKIPRITKEGFNEKPVAVRNGPPRVFIK